jgi:hypothetical protein
MPDLSTKLKLMGVDVSYDTPHSYHCFASLDIRLPPLVITLPTSAVQEVSPPVRWQLQSLLLETKLRKLPTRNLLYGS